MLIVIIVIVLVFIVFVLALKNNNEFKVKGKCIDIKESSNMKSPIFEINYNKQIYHICNEHYVTKLKIKIGDKCTIIAKKTDLNDFRYEDKGQKQVLKIIVIFTLYFLLIILNINKPYIRKIVGIPYLAGGLYILINNIIKVMLLNKKCPKKLTAKILYFNLKTEESYSYEQSYTSLYKKYSPVYEFVYNGTNYKVSSNFYTYKMHKLLKQGNKYKIKINPKDPNIFIDKIFIFSKAYIATCGTILSILGIYIIFF